MVGSLINAFSSMYKANQASKEKGELERQQRELDASRPQYQLNPAYQKNVSMYTPYANTSKLAGQDYMQNRIDANTANQVALASQKGLSSPSGIASLYGSAMNAQNQATTEMNIQGAENRKDYQGLLADANVSKAEEEDKVWNQNVWSPYAMKQDRLSGNLTDTMNRLEQYRTNQQASGAQAGQDAGNFAKTFAGKGTGGDGDTKQKVAKAPKQTNSRSNMGTL